MTTVREKVIFFDVDNTFICREENEMFEVVDYAIAMGNGCEALKAKANYVTESISKQGVYKALKNLNII